MMRCPEKLSVSRISAPDVSESGVRVSLTVSTAQRTESGASARWAATPPVDIPAPNDDSLMRALLCAQSDGAVSVDRAVGESQFDSRSLAWHWHRRPV